MNNKIDIKYFIVLSLAFILFTVIGTISHEYGHIIVAKQLGYETQLHYGSMDYDFYKKNKRYVDIQVKNHSAIRDGKEFPEKTFYEKESKKLTKEILLITMGGPLQTMVTGLLGLLIIILRKKHFKTSGLQIIDWLGVFLTLFWLREVFNPIVSLGKEIIAPDGIYFDGDEENIAQLLQLPSGTISISLGIIGLLISLYVIYKIIPQKIRLTFIASGIVGGSSGYVLWLYCLGPIVLP